MLASSDESSESVEFELSFSSLPFELELPSLSEPWPSLREAKTQIEQMGLVAVRVNQVRIFGR